MNASPRIAHTLIHPSCLIRAGDSYDREKWLRLLISSSTSVWLPTGQLLFGAFFPQGHSYFPELEHHHEKQGNRRQHNTYYLVTPILHLANSRQRRNR